MTDQMLVAYDRNEVCERALTFAAERAVSAGDSLHVYHISESEADVTAEVEAEVDDLLDDLADDLDYEVVVEGRDPGGDRGNVSKPKRLLDRIDTYNYRLVVMGNEPHGPIEGLTIPSMTEAVLAARSVPVTLVP